MKTSIGLLIVYVIAVVVVLIPSPPEFIPIGLVLIAPNVVFIFACLRRKLWVMVEPSSWGSLRS